MTAKKNAKKTGKFTVIYGGWYERTTLHLSEVYDLMALRSSKLDLSKEKISELCDGLGISTVSREAGYLEFVKAMTADGILIKYYEDGLYVLESEIDDIADVPGERVRLEKYFNENLNPALSYIFSLGAPTPKVLANIKTNHPTVVSGLSPRAAAGSIDEAIFGPIYSSTSSSGISVIKTPLYIFVMATPASASLAPSVVENLIFFREFKDHLEKYLNIHRSIWEEIADIKEKKAIRGRDVDTVRGKLDSYQKTIELIANRINQMGSYVKTRSEIAGGLKVGGYLEELFQYKFETLLATLDYIKEIWNMTSGYLTSSINNLLEIKGQSTARGVQSLQVITSLGVVSGIIGYISRNELPRVTAAGAIYFAGIITFTYFVNVGISRLYKNKKYNLKFGNRAEEI